MYDERVIDRQQTIQSFTVIRHMCRAVIMVPEITTTGTLSCKGKKALYAHL